MNGVLFNEDIRRSEDRDLSIRIYLESNARFAFSEKITGTYYRHENSLTSDSTLNSLHTTIDHIKIFSGYLDDLPLNNASTDRLKNLLYNRHLQASYYYRKLNCHRLAVASIRSSFRYKVGLLQFTELGKTAISYLACKFGLRAGEEGPTSAS